MPRFLNTWTGEFEWHDPKKVRYAILSHVWRTPEEGGEQTFDDVRRIQAAVKAAHQHPSGYDSVNRVQFPDHRSTTPGPGTLPHAFPPGTISIIFSKESPLSDKIKGLCQVARGAGFDLVWNDACCIDKSSSAELSEAINSMYEWYRLSDMCYVYLADVPHGETPHGNNSYFWKSRWHRRGWTLQELLAPERIEFLTSRWTFLGTKLGLAITLAAITWIDGKILLGRAPVHSASVAERMSWAGGRETTRIEDRAYSLMGLFGVHMSPIYGEGANAFLRLQEEIIRTIPRSLLRHRSDPPPSKALLPLDSLPTLDLWHCGKVVFYISPDSVANLHTLGFTTSPLQVAYGRQEITLETTLVCRLGLHSIPLRLSLEELAIAEMTRTTSPRHRYYATIRFSSAAPPSSPGLASSSGLLGNDNEQIQEVDTVNLQRRYTLAQFDLLIRPNPHWHWRPQQTRLLRISLERAPNGRRPSDAPNSLGIVFLVIEMSEEYEHIFKSRCVQNVSGDTKKYVNSASEQRSTPDFNRGSASLTSLPGIGSQSPDATTTRCTALEERVNTLQEEKRALCAEVSTATSQLAEVKSEVAALAGQNAALSRQNASLASRNTAITSQNVELASQNAALHAQMAAVWQQLDALTATTKAHSSLLARAHAA